MRTPRGSTTRGPGDVGLDAGPFAGLAVPSRSVARDARIADATRNAHNPRGDAKKIRQPADFLFWCYIK